MSAPGQRLRLVREELGYTLRDVEQRSIRLAERLSNDEYAIPLSRLSDIETKGVLPSIYRMYSLAVLYRLDYHELLNWYGIDLKRLPKDLAALEPRRTYRSQKLTALPTVEVPMRLDPSFDLRRTSNFGRLIEKWGMLPLTHLKALSEDRFTYGYIGSEDYTMYPLVMPGSFVQVDETRNEVIEGVWRSEYERPIYFVETREEHICCWCSIKGECLILQPHPLSPVPIRMMRYRQEADVIGQVVGIAMRLDQFSAPESLPDSKAPAKPN